jgi:uncharacterized SAM-binding protein YcdF (DUF218 family)
VLWALTLAGVVISAALLSRDSALPAPADAILCLGADVGRDDPSLPDAASDRRARECAALQAAGVAPVVLFTGYGTPGHSAADAMAARAIALGLPPQAALRERQARSTIQNAAFSASLLPSGAERVVLVSDAFHLPRAWVVFRLLGYRDVAIHAAPVTGTTEDGLPLWRWMLRESVAIWFNLARAGAFVAGGWVGIDRDTRIGWFN